MAKSEIEGASQGDSATNASVDNNNNTHNNNTHNKDQNDGPSSRTAASSSGGKYQLRPRSLQHSRRRSSDADWNLQETLRHKPRPPPLSRYRRKTANARERYRMRQINTAFESLRGVLPSWVCSRRTASDMTKITTLKLASAYIRSLQDILDGKAHQDTCSWVLSSILEEASSPQETQADFHFEDFKQDFELGDATKTLQPPAIHPSQDSDFVSFLCGDSSSSSSSAGVFHDNLETFSYLSPMSETEAVAILMGSDPPRMWSEGQQTSLVS